MFRGVGKILQKFSAGHGHVRHQPIYAPSVQDKIIYLNIYNDGTFERIPAYIGESLLEALTRFHFSSVPGHCQGGEKLDTMLKQPVQPDSFGPACSSCHVLILSPWVEKLNKIHYLEESKLNEAEDPSLKHSRLACCIRLEKWMDEMQVSIPLNMIDEDD